MVHTLSGIVLHRLWRMSAASDTPSEACLVIGEMVARVREIDPQFFDRFDNPPMDEPLEWTGEPRAAHTGGEAFAREFDAKLGSLTSQLVDYSPRALAVMADAYRAVVGLTAAECPDAEALDRMLNPARNPYRRETLNIGVHAPVMRALQHANFTFAKKISHTADSQDQRHRMVPGSRPLLTLADTRAPDYITPALIRDNPRALEVYERAMHEAGPQKTNCSIEVFRQNSRCIFCRTPKRSASSNPARSSTFSTNGRCAPASTRKKRSIKRPSKKWSRSAKCSRTRALHWPALLPPRRNLHPHLHRRLSLLRRKSLDRFPQHPTKDLRQERMDTPRYLAYCGYTIVVGCVVGCVWFMVVATMSGESEGAVALGGHFSDFGGYFSIVLLYLFDSFMVGWFPALLFGAFLHFVMFRFGWMKFWQWALVGAAMAWPLFIVGGSIAKSNFFPSSPLVWAFFAICQARLGRLRSAVQSSP